MRKLYLNKIDSFLIFYLIKYNILSNGLQKAINKVHLSGELGRIEHPESMLKTQYGGLLLKINSLNLNLLNIAKKEITRLKFPLDSHLMVAHKFSPGSDCNS